MLLVTGLQMCLLLFVLADVASAAGNVSGYAWSTNVGWINFAPDGGGVAVYSDHLEGYAWGENVGWIKLGACMAGSPCTYANTSATTYGVNNDGGGNLSGYAWGANVGWINFDPDGAERVTIDPVTGDFSGYAWGENVGWIHFQGSSPAYKVATTWRASQPPVGNIDATNKWAWSTNTGWINLRPDNGGVTVYDDHLEGYAWGENIGWVRLGTCSGQSCSHSNNSSTSYGVNNDGGGNLSGFAWSTNAGWINFNPDGPERVTIDPATGDFGGYAWGENVGWIRFQSSSPAYKATTSWRGTKPPTGNIDSTNKWAWSASAGWINFAPDNGGATVYDDHVQGYAWGENLGWLRLGTCSGSPCTHANTSAGNYGVNNDGYGQLSGYAWSANAGWVNFNPDGAEQVIINPTTGEFSGYAWGENVGWIHFRSNVLAAGTAPAGTSDVSYGVTTTWRGAPLAVDVTGFDARADNGIIRLHWETVSEADLAGFNVERAETPDGPWTRLNQEMIAARSPGAPNGNSYDWNDETPLTEGGAWYRLEAVDSSGGASIVATTSVHSGDSLMRVWLPAVMR